MSEVVYDGRLVMHLQNNRGPSAYDIAVQNGFEGTEAEWLESLKGPPGLPGDSVTVNGVEPKEGNISLYSSSIPVQRGSGVTVKQKLDELTSAERLTSKDIVNDLTTGGTNKMLSAEQGKVLNETKASGFAATVQIPMGNWNGEGPYTRDIALEGVSEDASICHVLMAYDPEHKEQFEDCGVVLMGQKKDAITVQAEAIPEEGFPVNVLVIITGLSEEASA